MIELERILLYKLVEWLVYGILILVVIAIILQKTPLGNLVKRQFHKQNIPLTTFAQLQDTVIEVREKALQLETRTTNLETKVNKMPSNFKIGNCTCGCCEEEVQPGECDWIIQSGTIQTATSSGDVSFDLNVTFKNVATGIVDTIGHLENFSIPPTLSEYEFTGHTGTQGEEYVGKWLRGATTSSFIIQIKIDADTDCITLFIDNVATNNLVSLSSSNSRIECECATCDWVFTSGNMQLAGAAGTYGLSISNVVLQSAGNSSTDTLNYFFSIPTPAIDGMVYSFNFTSTNGKTVSGSLTFGMSYSRLVLTYNNTVRITVPSMAIGIMIGAGSGGWILGTTYIVECLDDLPPITVPTLPSCVKFSGDFVYNATAGRITSNLICTNNAGDVYDIIPIDMVAGDGLSANFYGSKNTRISLSITVTGGNIRLSVGDSGAGWYCCDCGGGQGSFWNQELYFTVGTSATQALVYNCALCSI